MTGTPAIGLVGLIGILAMGTAACYGGRMWRMIRQQELALLRPGCWRSAHRAASPPGPPES